MDRDRLLRRLARVVVASVITAKRGATGHWTEYEFAHRDEAVLEPLSYHLPLCPVSAANHYYPARLCHPRCAELRELLAEVADALGCDLTEFWTKERRTRVQRIAEDAPLLEMVPAVEDWQQIGLPLAEDA